MQDRVFYSISFGFLFGVLFRSFLFLNIYLAILFWLIIFAVAFIFYITSPKHSVGGLGPMCKWSMLASIFILSFCFGIFRFNMVDVPAPEFFESQVGQKVTLVGDIVDEPTIGEKNQKLTVKVIPQGLALESLKARPFPSTNILVSTSLERNYKYGDKINFSGKLEKPENFMTDQGKVFDYINYLRKDGVLYIMSYPSIEIVSIGNGNKIKSELFSLKEKFLEKINLAISSPESLLMGGLILGEKSSFSADLRDRFIDTGTIHIVALSGYNVTIVAQWLMKLFSRIYFLPQNFGISIGILAIVLFIVMTGASSTAIRAGIMATLVLIARLTGRNYDVSRALILAAVCMTLLNPFVLFYDVSFQLSFIATIAVIFFTPKIEKHFLWVTESFGLRDIVSVTCAAYIFVMPFILYKMGNLSLVAIPANVLILPFIPFTMLIGFVTGFLGLVFTPLSFLVGYVSYLFLHYELWVIGVMSQFAYASLSIPNFPLFITILIYGYFVYLLFGRSLKDIFNNFPI